MNIINNNAFLGQQRVIFCHKSRNTKGISQHNFANQYTYILKITYRVSNGASLNCKFKLNDKKIKKKQLEFR